MQDRRSVRVSSNLSAAHQPTHANRKCRTLEPSSPLKEASPSPRTSCRTSGLRLPGANKAGPQVNSNFDSHTRSGRVWVSFRRLLCLFLSKCVGVRLLLSTVHSFEKCLNLQVATLPYLARMTLSRLSRAVSQTFNRPAAIGFGLARDALWFWRASARWPATAGDGGSNNNEGAGEGDAGGC